MKAVFIVWFAVVTGWGLYLATYAVQQHSEPSAWLIGGIVLFVVTVVVGIILVAESEPFR